jgi:ssRNA-specific RNase YbeY (16S rRNA maturation enzyme)
MPYPTITFAAEQARNNPKATDVISLCSRTLMVREEEEEEAGALTLYCISDKQF